MILIRYFLICIIGYLLVRSFLIYSKAGTLSSEKHDADKKTNIPDKKVSKKIGEYVDYEEIKKK